MNQKPSNPTEANRELPFEDTIHQVTSAVDRLAGKFGEIYERLNYPGYVSVFGAILIFFPLVTRKIPGLSLETHEQALYVGAGTLFVLLAAFWLCIQNLLIFKLQKLKHETAYRMLELKVRGVQGVHDASIEGIQHTESLPISDDPFKHK